MSGRAGTPESIVDVIKNNARNRRKLAGLTRQAHSGIYTTNTSVAVSGAVSGASGTGGSNLWSAINIDVDKDMQQRTLTNLNAITFRPSPHTDVSIIAVDSNPPDGVKDRIEYYAGSGGAHDFYVRSSFTLIPRLGITENDIFSNVRISPGTTNSIDLGSAGLAWKTVFASTIRLVNSGSVINNITALSRNSGGDMQFMVPATRQYQFYANGVIVCTITPTSLSTDNAIIGQSLVINNAGLDPLSNGEFRRNGADVKVYSGGNVKNISQMPQLNITNTFTASCQFNAGIGMREQFFLVLDNNDTSSSYLRQSSGTGVAPRVVDLAVWSDICFKGVGESSSALSRGMIKAMQKNGDPTTSEIPSGLAAVHKHTGTGVVKLWYNDAGTLKSVTLS